MRSLISFLLASTILFQCTTEKKTTANRDWTSTYQIETGKPVSMTLTIYKTTMLANGRDNVRARVAVIDSTGREIKDAVTSFRIYVTGDATISGEGLSLITTDSISYRGAKLSGGSFSFILQAGTSPDKIKLEVKADSIWPASHEIHTLPADFVMMKPSKEQLTVTIKTIDPMLGADISFLPQMEERGMKFFVNGQETDAVKALAEIGLNYIRLRTFFNPENEKGYSPQKGFCGLEETRKMARRVNESGMKLLLDFHYSDYWADPQQQYKPLAWQDMSYEELKGAVKEYTKSVLLNLKEQGTLPDMVQVGNEINHGLLWPLSGIYFLLPDGIW